jgi:hypothetical protein
MTAFDLAAALPGPGVLRERSRVLALLDTVVGGRSDHPRHSFDARWAPGEELAAMDNGAGDTYSIVFSAAGTLLRGFDHESPMSPYAGDDETLWPGLTAGVPPGLAHHLDEPAFSLDGTLLATVCLWREAGDDRWHAGDVTFPPDDDPDGSGWLFGLLLDPTGAAYVDFAGPYYDRVIDAAAVAELWATRQPTVELLRRLNPAVPAPALAGDLAAMGWPPLTTG